MLLLRDYKSFRGSISLESLREIKKLHKQESRRYILYKK